MMNTESTYSRVSTLLQIAGPKTFRLASKKLFYFNEDQPGYGTNMQNWEKSARQKVEADEGKLLVQCDQSGADAKVVANLMPKGNALRMLFDNGIKIHNYLAVMFPEQWEKEFPEVREFRDIPISQIKQHPKWSEFKNTVAASDDNPPATRYYYHYKTVGHSGNYGIMAGGIVENLLLKSAGKVRLTNRQAEIYLKGYHGLIPEIRNNFHRYVAHCYEKDGVLYTCQGFPIHITQKVFNTSYNKIYDKIPQATVAIITHIAATKFQRFVIENNLKWDLLSNTHDSYVAQAPGYFDTDGKPQGEALECAKVMRKFIEEQELKNQYGEIFYMAAESQVGLNWNVYKPKKNEMGLRAV